MPYYSLFPRRNTGFSLDEDEIDAVAQMPGIANAPGSSSMNQFSTLAGLAAQAISPNSWGGRLGGNVAGLAMRNEQMAAPYNQLMFQSRLAARSEQARQRRLQGLLGRLGTPMSRLSVQEGEPTAFGAEPSAFGAPMPRVTTSLVEGERTGYPEITPEDYAGLTELLGPQGAQGMVGLFARTGRIPLTPEEIAKGYKPTSPGGSQFNVVTGQYEGGQAPTTNVQNQVRGGSSIPPSAAYPQGYTAPAPPAATGQGEFRPGYVDPATGVSYPAVEPQYAPNKAFVPPATSREASRPAFTSGGIEYPAVGPLFTPKEQAVSFPAGSTYSLSPGAPLRVATPTARQDVVPLTPGGSAYRGGKIVATAPQTERQKATGEKAGKPTEGQRNVEALAAYIATDPTFEAVPGSKTWYGATIPAQSRAQRVMDEWVRESGVSAEAQAQRHRAWQRAFGAGGTAPAASTSSAPTATGPNGQKLILRNGKWEPLQ